MFIIDPHMQIHIDKDQDDFCLLPTKNMWRNFFNLYKASQTTFREINEKIDTRC